MEDDEQRNSSTRSSKSCLRIIEKRSEETGVLDSFSFAAADDVAEEDDWKRLEKGMGNG